MRRILRAGAFSLAMHFCTPATLHAQASGCLPAGSFARDLLSYARKLAVSTSPADARTRTLAGFTTTDSTKVVIETVARSCTAGVAGVNAALSTPNRARLIYLIRMNTQGFLAYQPSLNGTFPKGEYVPLFALKKTGAYTASFLF
jgi:hypothetical protein